MNLCYKALQVKHGTITIEDSFHYCMKQDNCEGCPAHMLRQTEVRYETEEHTKRGIV